MLTLREQLEELKNLKRRLAIWEAIHHLVDDKFISKDGRKVSGIRLPQTEELIPEDEIEDVLKFIGDGPILELKTEIEDIETRQVMVLDSNKGKNEQKD